MALVAMVAVVVTYHSVLCGCKGTLSQLVSAQAKGESCVSLPNRISNKFLEILGEANVGCAFMHLH